MPKNLTPLIRYLVLLAFWLLFPPLFLLFSIIWNIPKKMARIILTIVAPLTLVLLLFVSYITYRNYYFYIERGSRSEIETKTEIKFPDYETVERAHFQGHVSFTGDFTMHYSIKLDTTNIKDFYNRINTQIQRQNISTGWSINDDGHYSFSHIANNTDEHQTLDLNIDKNTALVEIQYGLY
jgi:hypothetical protein